MKVIRINRDFQQTKCKFTGIAINSYGVIIFFKDGEWHNDNYPAVICLGPNGKFYTWWYKNEHYGANDAFTIKTWKMQVKEIKLSIFK